MTAPSDEPRVNVLHIDSRPNDARAEALISVDGIDILELQRPTRRPDGTAYPRGPFVYLPPDPVGLLPPDSSALLPTATPRRTMVGICACGFAPCGSLWTQIRRDGDRVIWEPARAWGSQNTINGTYRFDLLAYLDAVDAGTLTVARWEQRPRRLARELRRLRDSLDGLTLGGSREGTAADVGSIHAGPGSDMIRVELQARTGRSFIAVPVPDDRGDGEIIDDLVRRGTDLAGQQEP